MNTFAERIIDYNQNLQFVGQLPDGFAVLNPYFGNPETMVVMRQFYEKYYNDHQKRKFIIGINPSRNGAGVTGVPFTDTKRLEHVCGIPMQSAHTHEISSVFLYDVIQAYGGPEAFYRDIYINSPFPLAIVRQKGEGRFVNANYYDNKALFNAVKDFMIESLKTHISMGVDTEEVYVLGIKNATFLDKINQEEKLFGKMIVLEHPRYIQQYRPRDRESFIDKYIVSLQ